MSQEKKDCFVIMPISDCEGYINGHFSRVYEDLIKPAVESAEFKSIRGDEVQKTNLIQLDILNKLLDTPIAICDLSSRNPNVLFELGIRQAFNMPVVLIQEKGTPRIFDINPLRYIEYSKELGYRDVIETQKKISTALTETYKAKDESGNVNSIVNLLAIKRPASIPQVKNEEELKTNIILSQLAEMKDMIMDVKNIRNSAYSHSTVGSFIGRDSYNDYINALENKYSSTKVAFLQGNISNSDFMNYLMSTKRKVLLDSKSNKILSGEKLSQFNDVLSREIEMLKELPDNNK